VDVTDHSRGGLNVRRGIDLRTDASEGNQHGDTISMEAQQVQLANVLR
jgi:hypothetical protein